MKKVIYCSWYCARIPLILYSSTMDAPLPLQAIEPARSRHIIVSGLTDAVILSPAGELRHHHPGPGWHRAQIDVTTNPVSCANRGPPVTAFTFRSAGYFGAFCVRPAGPVLPANTGRHCHHPRPRQAANAGRASSFPAIGCRNSAV